jgi:hypothetical protein
MDCHTMSHLPFESPLGNTSSQEDDCTDIDQTRIMVSVAASQRGVMWCQ